MNFDFGNILTRTLQITWKHKVFLGILTLPMLVSFAIFPLMFASLIFLEEGTSSEINNLFFVLFIIVFTIFIFASTFFQIYATSAVTLGIVRAESGEGSLRFMDLLNDNRKYFWRQMGTFLIVQLSMGFVFGIFFAFIMLTAIVTMGMSTLCFQPIMILLTPLMYLVMALLEAAQTAIVTENLGAWDSIKRAFAVVREHVWKYVILTIIIYFGVMMVTSIFMFPMMIPFMAVPLMAESGSDLSNSVIFGVMASFMCIFFPIMAILSGISQALLKTSLTLTYLRLSPPKQNSENQVIFSNK